MESHDSEIIALRNQRLGEVNAATLLTALKGTGFVHLRGFNATEDDFTGYSSQFGYCQDARSVSMSRNALGFHTEDGYNPFRPDALWFACLAVGSDGGTPTIVCDGVQLYRELDDETRDYVTSNRLTYERQWDAACWQSITGIGSPKELASISSSLDEIHCQLLHNGDLYVRFEAPMVHQLDATTITFANSLLQALTRPHVYGADVCPQGLEPEIMRRLEATAARIERHLKWSVGDVAVLDNRRVMHRRAQYQGEGRIIRARHCEDMFGTTMVDLPDPRFKQLKRLLQGEAGDVIRVGPPQQASATSSHGSVSHAV